MGTGLGNWKGGLVGNCVISVRVERWWGGGCWEIIRWAPQGGGGGEINGETRQFWPLPRRRPS